MGFLKMLFCITLILIWIVSGGYITQTSVFIHAYRSQADGFKKAYTYSTWAAVITWLLIAFVIILIIYVIAGVVVLFGTGVGEVGAGGAAAAEGADVAVVEGEQLASREAGQVAERRAAQSLEKRAGKKELGKLGNSKQQLKQQKKQKKSSIISWIFLIGSMILVFVTGALSAATANEIKTSGKYDSSDKKLKTAYEDAIIAACLCLSSVGLIIIGAISYAVYKHKQQVKAQDEERQEEEQQQYSQQNSFMGGIRQYGNQIYSQAVNYLRPTGYSGYSGYPRYPGYPGQQALTGYF